MLFYFISFKTVAVIVIGAYLIWHYTLGSCQPRWSFVILTLLGCTVGLDCQIRGSLAGRSEQRLARFTYSRAKHDHCLLNCVVGTGNDGQSAAVACSALAHIRPLTRSAECGGAASPPCELLSRIHDDSSPQRSCPLAHDAAPEPRPLLQHWHPGQCSDRTAHTAS